MEPTLLDTDVVSELMRGKNLHVRDRAAMYQAQYGVLTISTLSILEIVKGLVKAGRSEKLPDFMQFAANHEVLTFDVDAAEIAGRLYASLEMHGMPIGRIDPLIAAIAIRHGLVLATGNLAHYERVRQVDFSLRLSDWRQP